MSALYSECGLRPQKALFSFLKNKTCCAFVPHICIFINFIDSTVLFIATDFIYSSHQTESWLFCLIHIVVIRLLTWMAQQCVFVHFASDTADKALSISLYCIVLINLLEPTKLCFSWELPERQKVLFLSNFGIPRAEKYFELVSLSSKFNLPSSEPGFVSVISCWMTNHTKT